MSVQSQKQELRKQVKELKDKICVFDRAMFSANIMRKVESDEDFQQAKTIMCYWAMKDEVQTKDFILKWHKEKQFVLPVVEGDFLKLRKFEGIENMQSSTSYNIQEPTGAYFEEPEAIDLVIVPGIAFDKQMNRMGRGKAYYDKFLRNLTVKKIGICYSVQLFDEIPHEDTDIKMDKVYTEF